MNISLIEINTLFDDLIAKRGVYKALCSGSTTKERVMMYNRVRSIRHRLKTGKRVTIDFKLNWLIRSGLRPGCQRLYTQTEVVKLIDHATRMNKQTRAMGGAFILEEINKSK